MITGQNHNFYYILSPWDCHQIFWKLKTFNFKNWWFQESRIISRFLIWLIDTGTLEKTYCLFIKDNYRYMPHIVVKDCKSCNYAFII